MVGADDFVYVLRQETVLALVFFEVFAGVDEEDVIGFFALFEDEDADGDAGGVEEVGGQADDGVDVAVFKEFATDASLGPATEEDAVGEDDGHGAFLVEVVEAVQEEGEVGGGFGREAVVFEAHVFAHCLGGFPAVAEGGIGDDGVEGGFSGGISFAEHVPVVGEGVAVEDGEFGVFDAVEEHVHAGEVVGGDILFLAVDFADTVGTKAAGDIEEEGAGAAGEVEDAFEV